MKPYLAEPFTNKFGQEIYPGDRVVVITTGYSHRLHEREGIYLGYREIDDYGVLHKKQQQVLCRVKTKIFGKWDANGKKIGWGKPGFDCATYEWRDIERVTNLWTNRIFKLD